MSMEMLYWNSTSKACQVKLLIYQFIDSKIQIDQIPRWRIMIVLQWNVYFPESYFINHIHRQFRKHEEIKDYP